MERFYPTHCLWAYLRIAASPSCENSILLIPVATLESCCSLILQHDYVISNLSLWDKDLQARRGHQKELTTGLFCHLTKLSKSGLSSQVLSGVLTVSSFHFRRCFLTFSLHAQMHTHSQNSSEKKKMNLTSRVVSCLLQVSFTWWKDQGCVSQIHFEETNSFPFQYFLQQLVFTILNNVHQSIQ